MIHKNSIALFNEPMKLNITRLQSMLGFNPTPMGSITTLNGSVPNMNQAEREQSISLKPEFRIGIRPDPVFGLVPDPIFFPKVQSVCQTDSRSLLNQTFLEVFIDFYEPF